MATAFVLTGGGSSGATEVGMPAALTDTDAHPDFVVGTSVGAATIRPAGRSEPQGGPPP